MLIANRLGRQAGDRTLTLGMAQHGGGASSSTKHVTMRVVGGPTALLDIDGFRILTDPTFSPPGEYESAPGRTLNKTEPPGLLQDTVGPVDLVLLSHDQHPDNLDPAGHELLASAPMVLSTPSAADRLGGNVRGLRPWEEVLIQQPEGVSLEVTAVPARHGPPGCEPATGEVTGFVVRGGDSLVVYVSGDNASLDAVQAIGDRYGQIDLALLFAGAARTPLLDGAALTLTSRDAVAAALLLAARQVVPLHVRGWAQFTEGPEVLRDAFAAAGLAERLCIIDPGNTATFNY